MTLGKRQILRKEKGVWSGREVAYKRAVWGNFEGDETVMYRIVLYISLYAFIKIHRTHTSKKWILIYENFKNQPGYRRKMGCRLWQMHLNVCIKLQMNFRNEEERGWKIIFSLQMTKTPCISTLVFKLISHRNVGYELWNHLVCILGLNKLVDIL